MVTNIVVVVRHDRKPTFATVSYGILILWFEFLFLYIASLDR